MTPINSIPNFDWNDLARRNIERSQGLVEESHVAYSIGNIGIAGLIYSNFLQPPWFWFALARGVTLRHLLDFRRLKERIPLGSLTAVDTASEDAVKFARVFGFVNTGQPYADEETIKIFRRS